MTPATWGVIVLAAIVCVSAMLTARWGERRATRFARVTGADDE